MSKIYKVTRSFWIGELNKELKVNSEVMFDETASIVTIGTQTYEVKNIKAAIKAGWLVPKDGVLPTLDGPVGETSDEASDRRRKERFVEIAKKDREHLTKDQREVVNLGGCIKDDNPGTFAKALNLDAKTKFKGVLVEDDTVIVKTGIFDNNKEVNEIKIALNQEKGEKIEPKDYKIFNDHYDSETVHVSTYTDLNKENTIKNWSTLHWTKKVDVIEKADRFFLEKLKNVESSEKMVNRINKKMETL